MSRGASRREEQQESIIGKVKGVNNAKGYGFLEGERKTISSEQPAAFENIDGQGPQAAP